MLYIIFIALFISPESRAFNSLPKLLKNDRIIEMVNSNLHSTWKASHYDFDGMNVDYFRRTRLGLKFKKNLKLLKGMKNVTVNKSSEVTSAEFQTILPEFFTWKNNTDCLIDYIRDQSNCGSCWAVASVSAFEDRICIRSKGKIKNQLSSGYVTSCNTDNYGCAGGYLDYVHDFFIKTGVITGGDFESDEGCQPYPIQPCSFQKHNRMPCVHPFTPKCRHKKCTNEWYKYKTEHNKNTFKARKYEYVYSKNSIPDEYVIRKEIYENGPVTAAFLVLEDFPYYKEGIYHPVGRYVLGGHAVRIVGWGVENDVNYWIIANSWGRDWGENGWFRMIRGINAVWIEDYVISAEPLLEKKHEDD